MKRFPSNRGRPRSDNPCKDLGTPELCFKRAYGLTEEPLDRCLAKQLIDDAQHWSGIHFRWLHTLRYGSCDATISRYGKPEYEVLDDDPSWRQAREAEYALAYKLLQDNHLLDGVRELCVEHSVPRCLYTSSEAPDPVVLSELESLRNGLDALAFHWGRKKTR